MQRSADQVLDELLVLEAQDGSRNALDELVRRWHARLLRHAWHLTGRNEDAAEVMQDSWLAVVRGLRRLDDPALFRAWAYRIVTNKCASFVRQRKRDRRAVTSDEPIAPEATSTVDARDEAHQLHDAMRRLGTDQRAILSLRYWEDMSTREIAAILGVPEGTVKSRLNQARNELQQHLQTRSERDDSVQRQTS